MPRKNVLPLAGLPLIAHSILYAKMCPEVDRCVVSTDDPEIARVAREYGAEVPFLRPPELALDTTPSLPVLQHAVSEMEREPGGFRSVLLLQPTNPMRVPDDLAQALRLLDGDAQATGVIAVSELPFEPRSVAVEDRDGYLAYIFPAAQRPARRQDAPRSYRINGLLYLFRRDFLMSTDVLLREDDRCRMLVIPEERSIDIDSAADLAAAEDRIRTGVVSLPWLAASESGR